MSEVHEPWCDWNRKTRDMPECTCTPTVNRATPHRPTPGVGYWAWKCVKCHAKVHEHTGWNLNYRLDRQGW